MSELRTPSCLHLSLPWLLGRNLSSTAWWWAAGTSHLLADWLHSVLACFTGPLRPVTVSRWPYDRRTRGTPLPCFWRSHAHPRPWSCNLVERAGTYNAHYRSANSWAASNDCPPYPFCPLYWPSSNRAKCWQLSNECRLPSFHPWTCRYHSARLTQRAYDSIYDAIFHFLKLLLLSHLASKCKMHFYTRAWCFVPQRKVSSAGTRTLPTE